MVMAGDAFDGKFGVSFARIWVITVFSAEFTGTRGRSHDAGINGVINHFIEFISAEISASASLCFKIQMNNKSDMIRSSGPFQNS